MDFTSIIPLVAVVLGFGTAIPLVAYSYKMKTKAAGNLAEQILDRAEKDIQSFRKEKELEAMDEARKIIQGADVEAKINMKNFMSHKRPSQIEN